MDFAEDAGIPIGGSVPEIYLVLKKQEVPVTLDEALVASLIKSSPAQLQNYLKELEHNKNSKLPNILIEGSIGIGKTDSARACAQKSGREHAFVPSSILSSEYQDSAAKNLDIIYQHAQKKSQPCIIILDDITVISKSFKDDQDPTQILLKLAKSEKVILFCTANNLTLPKELIELFKVVHMELPSAHSRRNIFQYYAKGLMSDALLEKAVSMTRGLSARDIFQLINICNENVGSENRRAISQHDMSNAIEELKKHNSSIQISYKEYATDLTYSYGQQAAELAEIGSAFIPYVGLPLSLVFAGIKSVIQRKKEMKEESELEQEMENREKMKCIKYADLYKTK